MTERNYAHNESNLPYYLRYPTPRISREQSHRQASPILKTSDFDNNYPTYMSDIALRMCAETKFTIECKKRRECIERFKKRK